MIFRPPENLLRFGILEDELGNLFDVDIGPGFFKSSHPFFVDILSPSGTKYPGLRQMHHHCSAESAKEDVGVVDDREIRAHKMRVLTSRVSP